MRRHRSPVLEAFEQQQLERNRTESDRALKSAKEWSPTAPIPTDPMRCRWCLGRLNVSKDFCTNGCAPSERAPFTGLCVTCERSFVTGDPQSTVQCYGCSERETQARQASERGVRGRRDDFAGRLAEVHRRRK